jgi:hypothetical protein
MDEFRRERFVMRKLDLVAACAMASACCGPLQAAADTTQGGDTRLHLEACTKWSEQSGSFGFVNACGEPVALLFIQLNGQHRFDRVVRPGERFETGVGEKTVDATGWLFTACPADYVPSVPLTTENQAQILKGQYECVRK